jgi:glycerophosphoryl diester phosphodiesterase
LKCFGWDAQHERVLRELITMRIDGVYCDDPDRMMSVLNGTTPILPTD